MVYIPRLAYTRWFASEMYVAHVSRSSADWHRSSPVAEREYTMPRISCPILSVPFWVVPQMTARAVSNSGIVSSFSLSHSLFLLPSLFLLRLVVLFFFLVGAFCPVPLDGDCRALFREIDPRHGSGKDEDGSRALTAPPSLSLTVKMPPLRNNLHPPAPRPSCLLIVYVIYFLSSTRLPTTTLSLSLSLRCTRGYAFVNVNKEQCIYMPGNPEPYEIDEQCSDSKASALCILQSTER